MIVELLTFLLIGIISNILGYRLIKKQDISVIHSYHNWNVKECDKEAYCMGMGKGMVILGTGAIIAGVLDYAFKTSYGWIIFTLALVVSFGFMVKTQKQYNGGIF